MLGGPGTSVEVDVTARAKIPLTFEVDCPLTFARVTATTTGMDIDLDGYQVVVDGGYRGMVSANGSVLTRLAPGCWTIAPTGLNHNCTIEGPASHTVSIADTEVAPVAFAVVCIAMSGVIGVVVEASGTDVNGNYQATVDGAGHSPVAPGGPTYLAPVLSGDHLVSLVAPSNCSVETDPQSVTLTSGGLIRDTVEVTFSEVICERGFGTLRITAPTSGPIPAVRFAVGICDGERDRLTAATRRGHWAT